MSRLSLIAQVLVLSGCCALARAETFPGRVVGVSAGDTITVLREGRGVKIRLQGIDAPEKDQAFGSRARQLTSSLAFGKQVTVRVSSTDRYGRIVAWVYLPGGACLNEELLKAGLAWHYKQYDRSPRLAALEAEARAARRGLWVEASPTPPWSFRQARRQKPVPLAGTGPLRGNVKNKVVHRPGCKAYHCKHCTRQFSSLEEALRAGFRPCGGCLPGRQGAR
jgi:endonuclease YncB( thermonuclease family)